MQEEGRQAQGQAGDKGDEVRVDQRSGGEELLLGRIRSGLDLTPACSDLRRGRKNLLYEAGQFDLMERREQQVYLSVDQCERLDAICGRFEVALRSYVAHVVTSRMDRQAFKSVLANIKDSGARSPIGSLKFQAKAEKLFGSNVYELLASAAEAFLSRREKNGNVPYVTDLASVVLLLYNPHFVDLGRPFGSTERFADLLTDYVTTRNSLAHPASARIVRQDAENVMGFIKGVLTTIDDEYCWYSSKEEINRLISELLSSLNNGDSTVLNNLSEASYRHTGLLMRETEMTELCELIYGRSPTGRPSGSVELFGYGGVGKTALAMEMCYEILRREQNGNGSGHRFILWLSSKSEELTYRRGTGRLHVRRVEPDYTTIGDVMRRLMALLKMGDTTDEASFLARLSDEKIRGLVVLDNLETLAATERARVRSMIKSFPREVQFLVTSRAYEGIAEDGFEVKGFADLKRGKAFVDEYCKRRGFEGKLDNRLLEEFIKLSCGNTLVLVLGLQRIIDGVSSLDSIVEELRVCPANEIETIAQFMYQNTLGSAISEIERDVPAVDCRRLLAIMFLYREPIDFHSLRELLEQKDSRALDTALEKLVARFAITKSHSYYELHEFAAKYVVLKYLPDRVQLRELEERVKNHKRALTDSLKRVYEDKQSSGIVKGILDDWYVLTEGDTIAVAQAYEAYSWFKRQLEAASHDPNRMAELVENVDDRFAAISARSNHPYIRFQKARTLQMILEHFEQSTPHSIPGDRKSAIQLQVLSAYEDAYVTIWSTMCRIASTESYAVFLWLWGMSLVKAGDFPHAARRLEESVEAFSALRKIRQPANAAKANSLFAYVCCIMYIRTSNKAYLNRISAAVHEAQTQYSNAGTPFQETSALKLYLVFVDACLGSWLPGQVQWVLRRFAEPPPHLLQIVEVIQRTTGLSG